MWFIQFVEKSFITAMDVEIDSRYGKWFIPPVKGWLGALPTEVITTVWVDAENYNNGFDLRAEG